MLFVFQIVFFEIIVWILNPERLKEGIKPTERKLRDKE